MKTSLMVTVIVVCLAPAGFCQEFDYQSTLDSIRSEIGSGDFAGALEETNQLKDFLKDQLKTSDATTPTVEAGELFASFSSNEQLAKKTYEGGTWIVHGTVTKIGSTYDDRFNSVPSVEMSVDDYGFKGVAFEFTDDDRDELAELSVGDDLKIEGIIGKFEMGLTVKVKNCKIVR